MKDDLTYIEVSYILLYDKETGKLFWKVRRGGRALAGQEATSISTRGYAQVGINNTCYQAHRLAWLLTYKCWPKSGLDHINWIKTDNRICNLREVSQQENMHNKSLYKNSKTGLTGVNWSEMKSTYQVRLSRDKVEKHLGYFTDFFEACCVRKSAEINYKV